MFKTNEDCFYFLTSTCAKGPSCTYRHSPLALTCNVICPAWLRGNCPDPACPFRHSSTLPRSSAGNGVLCFYENTPTGCLKPECTFVHTRSRLNLKTVPTIRPATLIKNDSNKPIVNTILPTNALQTPPIVNSNTSSPRPVANETPSGESDSSSVAKTEAIPRRIAVPTTEVELANEKKNPSDDNNNNNNSLTTIKPTTRSIITNSPKANQEETTTTTTTTTQSRLIVNRSVVLNESASSPSRTVVQASTTSSSSSKRIVVSSNDTNSPLKDKKNDLDLVDEEISTKKLKQDPQSIIDIPFPCSTPSLTNRLLLSSSKEKEVPTTNDTKPIRLHRNRLPATTLSSANSLSTEEKTSAGTELSKDEERRTMRIERFQKKPVSPPRSIITNSPTTRNVVTAVPNERKRTAPQTTPKDLPPSKRISISSPSSIQNGKSSTTTPVPSKSVLTTSPARPRFTPQLITAPSKEQSSSSTGTARPRQPPSVVTKRPLASAMSPSSTSSIKAIEQTSLHPTEKNISPSSSSKSTIEQSTSNTPNEEDENQLLKLNDSADVVDTFALIDEALLEADHLLELM